MFARTSVAAGPALHRPAASVACATAFHAAPSTTSCYAAPPACAVGPTHWATRRSFLTSSLTRRVRVSGHGGGQQQQQQSLAQQWMPQTGGGGGSTGGGSAADAMTPAVRQHMMRVYTLLAAGVAVAGCGSAAMFMTPLGKMIPPMVCMLGGFVPLLWLSFRPPADPNLKLALFFTFTLLQGMGIAPLVLATAAKGVLGSALVLTAAIFLGFSASAMLAPRASLVKFQGPLMGMLLGMMAVSILGIFYPTAFGHSIVLYGGLAIFSALIAVDTQSMIERASCGGSDHVGDAVSMFLNVMNIFIRIASIMRGD